MIRNKFGILVPETPVMEELITRLPNQTPLPSYLTFYILADADNRAIADADDAAIETNYKK